MSATDRSHDGHRQTGVEGCDECTAEYMQEQDAFMATDDAQSFCQVTNLAPGSRPTIWMRYFGNDFMAEVKVSREGKVQRRRITATGDTIAETLENLAANVAEFLYPVAKPKAKAGAKQ